MKLSAAVLQVDGKVPEHVRAILSGEIMPLFEQRPKPSWFHMGCNLNLDNHMGTESQWVSGAAHSVVLVMNPLLGF